MKKNRFFVILSALLLLAGCKDFTKEDKSSNTDNTVDSEKAYIYLSTIDFARTVNPVFTPESIENYAVTLSAKKSSETDITTIASYEKFSELPTSATPIAIDLGTYVFTLTATDGQNNILTDTTSEIEIVGGSNPLTFNLKWVEPESFSGVGSFTLTLNIADDVDVSDLVSAEGELYEWDVLNATEASLSNTETLTITTDSVTQKKSVTYTKDNVNAGVYHVKITLYADSEKTVPLVSPYPEIVIITDGQNSNASRIITSLNPVYSINCVVDGGTLSGGNSLPSKYTAYSEITLPDNLQKDNYEFKGWYTNPSFAGNAVDGIPKGSSGNKTFYAMFVPNGGFVYVRGATIDFAVGSGETASRIFNGTSITVANLLVCDHEVTQDEYMAVMGTNPTSSGNKSNPSEGEVQGNRPVDSVSWYAAIAYCNVKSESEGRAVCYSIDGITSWTNTVSIPTSDNSTWNSVTYNQNANGYRLLTEAEWEYVARGGNGLTGEQYIYSGSNSLGEYAWYEGNASSKTHEVKKKLPNGLKVYDMTGNLREWCWDLYDSKRVTRGGCIGDTDGADSLKNKGTTAYFYAPTVNGSGNGFRICCTAP